MRKYWGPVRVLAPVVIIAALFALIAPSITSGIADERVRNGVLIQALPFFGAFVAVLLTYILLIFLIALRFNGKIPNRTYSGVETVLIVGILGGVVLLFQPIHFVGYRYGFLLVLGALLSFIVWSHVIGRSAKADVRLPRFTGVQQAAGAAAFVVIAVLIAGLVINTNAPREPYGVRERVWNTYDDARKAEIAAAASSSFNTVEIPFVIAFSLVPAALFFFIVREAAASLGKSEESTDAKAAVPQRSSA
ncbi:MAG: hypothetical protein SF162_01745 [bacterium]|nr:hypothetical protein [bacterium]